MRISKIQNTDKSMHSYRIDCENCDMHSGIEISIFAEENENIEELFKKTGWIEISGFPLCPRCADNFYNPKLDYGKLTSELSRIIPDVAPYSGLGGYKPPMVLYDARLKKIDDYFRHVSRIDEYAVAYVIENLVKQIDSLERKILEMELNK